MTLHEELNKAEKVDQNNNYIPNIDQTNKVLMFQNFLQDFKNRNKSIISDLFYAVNCNITKCGLCNTEIFNYQIYFFLIFPLEEVRKFKSQYNGFNQFNQFNQFNYQNNFINNNNEVNIIDCFNYNQKVNFMTGENSMYCNRCRVNCDCSMWTYLVTGPEILIIILNRGKGIEFNIKIYFEEYLDLSNFIEYKNTGCKYQLIGVITHIGESSMSGHFISYCKDPIKGDWYKYNDAIVNKVENFQNEVINFAMPYLLFYQKING
jgi:ubiquitin C-terminal hydrolase